MPDELTEVEAERVAVASAFTYGLVRCQADGRGDDTLDLIGRTVRRPGVYYLTVLGLAHVAVTVVDPVLAGPGFDRATDMGLSVMRAVAQGDPPLVRALMRSVVQGLVSGEQEGFDLAANLLLFFATVLGESVRQGWLDWPQVEIRRPGLS